MTFPALEKKGIMAVIALWGSLGLFALFANIFGPANVVGFLLILGALGFFSYITYQWATENE